MKEINLKVKGMHCVGCENRIKNSLSLIEGVKEVEANYQDGKVTIKCDNESNLNEMKERINDLGFEEIFDSDDVCVVEWPEFIKPTGS